MDLKRHLLETATLVAAAALCAAVSNSLADRERKPPWVGTYRSPTDVPPARTPPPSAPLAPTSVAEAPVPEPRAVTSVPAAATPAPKPAATPRPAAGAPAASAPAPEDPKKRFPPHGQPYREISGDDVAWLHARGTLFLDARRSKVFEEGHIAGARSFPVWEDEVVTGRLSALAGEGRDGAMPVVLYCSGGNCEDSHMLAEKLFGLGFNNLLVYHDGWPDWQKRGGASRTGPE